MTDQTIPAEKVREARERAQANIDGGYFHGGDRSLAAAEVVLALTEESFPTLADMTPEEREACKWMQADITDRGTVVIINADAGNGKGCIITSQGYFATVNLETITPRPDLPKMVWPSGDAPTVAKHENVAPDQQVNPQGTLNSSEPQPGEEWIEAANQASKESLEDRGYSFNEERTPQAGEAWLVENGGDHAVGFKIRDGRWVIYNPNHYKIRNPHLVTPFARLVPEA